MSSYYMEKRGGQFSERMRNKEKRGGNSYFLLRKKEGKRSNSPQKKRPIIQEREKKIHPHRGKKRGFLHSSERGRRTVREGGGGKNKLPLPPSRKGKRREENNCNTISHWKGRKGSAEKRERYF